jgi:hypothetical protein
MMSLPPFLLAFKKYGWGPEDRPRDLPESMNSSQDIHFF